MDELSRDINTMNVNTFPELIPGSLVLLRTTDLNKAKEFSRIQKLKFSLRKDKIPLKRKPNNMSSLEYEAPKIQRVNGGKKKTRKIRKTKKL